MPSKEPSPNLKLKDPKKPLQIITISRMPASLYDELKTRADKYSQKINRYCRIILEHAYEHRNDYEGIIERTYNSKSYSEKVHIQLLDDAFKKGLKDWDPYGVKTYPDIALSILKKHIETRKW